ncbi:hypothetical protein SAMN04488514_116114 [Kriegella aquimaris]|uniref:Uncharacterized protein n=2 Tax=Kriegella aquimaris TaxID=192904 RepID=A0A1G9WYI0_9FLAO|nr:hypothetical protein SAMN04488514_116114 [Kriegella aquimaris]
MVFRKSRKYGNIQVFLWAGERKGKRFFLQLVLLCGREGVVKNWNGKTEPSDWRSMSAWEGTEWRDCMTSAGLGTNIEMNSAKIYLNLWLYICIYYYTNTYV